VSQDFHFIKRAGISDERQGPGSVDKVLIDESGSHHFSKFVRLEIARNGSDGGYYLFHISQDGTCTDTWHATLHEALDEACSEYGVAETDWQDIA
jgi:hypothetical protein